MTSKTQTIELRAPLREVTQAIDKRRDEAIEIADKIWDLAEPPMSEFKSAELLEQYLRTHGFRVTRPWEKLPTAFRAVAGVGKPTIALLAEYDALPDCGPRPGQWGHGCGHNLLGAASALAGIIAAEILRKKRKAGRIIVFGTPAEETLGGKVYMAQERAFRGLDAVLAWHPQGRTCANLAGGAAMDSLSFVFRGKTAHAGAKPHEGRSALDAALLTDIAVNYLREHVESNVRIHSVIPDGGKAPNVVPDRAEIWYYVRGRSRRQVDDLRRRVVLCAKGAATATETRCRMTVHTSTPERMQSRALAQMLDAILQRLGPPKFTPAETRAARKTLPGCKYANKIEPISTDQGTGSSDEDNVSWFAPLGRIDVACVPVGTTSHHRSYASLVRTAGGHRGMLKAAQVMASGAIELIVNPPLLRKTRTQFKKAIQGKKYNMPISPGAKPPAYKVD